MNVEKAEPPALSFILAVGDEVLRLQKELDAALELCNQLAANADAYRAERDEAVAALVKVTDALARRQS